MYQQVGIVGVGLIGASLGRALKARRLAKRIIGIGRSQESLDQALALEAIDEAYTRIGAELASVELLVVCTPVPLVADVVERAWTILSPEALITDAGSAKSGIVIEVENRRPKDRRVSEFVGSHPMAGSHRRGPEASRADLFENHPCIVSNSPTASVGARDRIKSLWKSLGMRVTEMSPEDHDHAVARISHVPHLASYALALAAQETDLPLAGPGFRDTTRLAASPSTLWTEIIRENRSAVLDALACYEAELASFRAMIESEDWTRLEKKLRDANRCIDRLGDSAQPHSS